jgi:hypothetical protein
MEGSSTVETLGNDCCDESAGTRSSSAANIRTRDRIIVRE